MKTQDEIKRQPIELYVVTNIEKHEGEDPEFFTIGAYTTLAKAQEAVRECFEGDTQFIFDDNEQDDWERTETDSNGSFRFESDEYNYYEYIIKKVTLDK